MILQTPLVLVMCQILVLVTYQTSSIVIPHAHKVCENLQGWVSCDLKMQRNNLVFKKLELTVEYALSVLGVKVNLSNYSSTENTS